MRDPRDAGDCLWTTWKASPAAKGARRVRLPATWNARGRFASTRAGVTRSPVMQCARRCVERTVALQDCADYFALPKFLEVPLQHCIAPVLYSRLSYVEGRGFTAWHT